MASNWGSNYMRKLGIISSSKTSNTGLLGYNTELADNFLQSGNFKQAIFVQAPRNGLLKSMGAIVGQLGDSAVNISLALYSTRIVSEVRRPYNLLGRTPIQAGINTKTVLNNLPIGNVLMTLNEWYCLRIWGSTSYRFYYNTEGAENEMDVTDLDGGSFDDWPVQVNAVPSGQYPFRMSIWGNYEY